MQQQISDAELVQFGQEGAQKLKIINQNPKWEKFSDKPCLMMKMQIDGRVASKGQVKVDFPIEKVFQFLSDENVLKILNPQLKSLTVLHVAKQAGQDPPKIVHQHYNGIWPVADRDFVGVSATLKTNDVIYLSFHSYNYPHPQQKGVVRAKVIIGGYILKVIDQNTTLVTYISDSDLCGSIPGMVKKQLSKRQATIASKIKEEMDKKK